MNEKRKEHRFKAALPVRIIYSGQEIISSTDNLSRLGTYAEVNREIPTGENLEVTLVLPAYTRDLSLTGEIKCKGNVFRSVLLRSSPAGRYYGVGIFFTVFNEPKHREKLSRYIDYLTEKEEVEIKEGLKKRREKEETGKMVKHSEEFYAQEEGFRKESLGLLHKISSQLEEMSRRLQAGSENK